MQRKSSRIAASKHYDEGRQLEMAGDIDTAIKKYQKALSQNPTLSAASNRLMIIFRRQKEYKKELAVIKEAIESYEEQLSQGIKDWASENKQSADLSRSLAKSLGLLTDKGIPKYEDKQVASWKKRIEVVQKKLK